MISLRPTRLAPLALLGAAACVPPPDAPAPVHAATGCYVVGAPGAAGLPEEVQLSADPGGRAGWYAVDPSLLAALGVAHRGVRWRPAPHAAAGGALAVEVWWPAEGRWPDRRALLARPAGDTLPPHTRNKRWAGSATRAGARGATLVFFRRILCPAEAS